MMFAELNAFWATALLIAFILGAAVMNHFASGSKERRRRRRSYGRVVSRAKGPNVQLNADVDRVDRIDRD
jgi:hypothetical protein